MSTIALPTMPGRSAKTPTANDRLHDSFRSWLWASIILATAAHFLLFTLWPEMLAPDVSFSSQELEAIDLQPEIEIPEPPHAIARPATPIIASGAIDEDITIAPTTFEMNPVSTLPPPPTLVESAQVNLAEAPVFTPFTVKPDIRNRDEVLRALEREYPPLLRDAGLGGTVVVWFFIDQEGRVQNTLVKETSGHSSLDEAALKVANLCQFTPALNRDKRVPVWISLPITFTTR